ncbi:hypothetical protein CDAR_456791 [Caerostris darwini]|uniref:Uncharacterized protein n=1 Tax=Caerostris darwini TaxID=1538125 RepID=A0AAV4TML9_9ARAC|nr:hypothetical protein CDAR_456791 [Caerostris darwini]
MSNKGFQTRSFDHRKQNNAGKISGNASWPLLVASVPSSAHLIHHPIKGQSTFHSLLKDLGFERSSGRRDFVLGPKYMKNVSAPT